jgi:hypothetical protein
MGATSVVSNNERGPIMKKHLLLSIVLALLCLSCEKILLPDELENTPKQNFDVFWETLDHKYSYFELKEVNWQSVYDSLKPKVSNQMRSEELFDLMAEALFLLKDGHTNLISGFDISRNWNWYLDFPANFEWNTIERNYLGKNHKRTGPFYHQRIDSVGYVYYESFGSAFSEGQLELVLDRYQNDQGLILDLRNNGGGSLSLAFLLASKFNRSESIAYYERAKQGPAPNDFSQWVPLALPSSSYQYSKPVVVLVNRACYSATNSFAAMLKNLPNITLMGDTTGGGGGLPVHSELPNGWTFRYSATQSQSRTGVDLESGIGPDIHLSLDSLQLAQGKDSFIEAALVQIKN